MNIQIDKQQSLLTTAFEVLLKNLGPQKTNQLWQVLNPLMGDYLNDRQKLFGRKSVSSLYKEAKNFNRK